MISLGMLYHGTITSLYETLPSTIIPVLEDAILKTRLRLYKAAEEIFNLGLSAYYQVPIVAFERSELYLSQFKFLQALQALDTVPDPLPKANEKDHDVQRLIMISRGIFKIKTEGVYEPALDAVQEIQREWRSKSVDDYTDIQVECIRKYALACIFLAASPTLITEEMKLMPTPKIPTSPPTCWKGLTDLRLSLVSQGRFMEALRFSIVERSLCTATDRYQNARMMLQLGLEHRTRALEAEDEICWRAAMLRLQLDLASLLTSWNRKAEARTWLSSLEKELEETIALVNGESGVLRTADALDTLSIEFCHLKLLEEDERTESHFQHLLDLGEKMLAGTHLETDQCHYLAISWAKQLYPDKQFVAIRTDIQLRTQHLFENVQGRVADAALNLVDILLPRTQNINETAQSIEMLDLFERKYPNITIPLTQKMMSSLRLSLYTQRGDSALPVSQGLGSDIGTYYKLRKNLSSTKLDEDDLKFKDVIDKQDNAASDDDLLYGFFSQPAETRAADLLYNIITQEAGSLKLSKDALGQIFALGENTKMMTQENFLKLNGLDMLQTLVGSADSPVTGEEWLKRLPALREWLLEDSRPELPLRRCLWVEIHNARSRAWKDHADKLNISALKRATAPNILIPGKKNPASLFFSHAYQLVGAIEARVGLDEARLGYMFNHFERETQSAASLLPLLYTQLFFLSRINGEDPGANSLSYLSRADDLAREQLAHWKSVDNYANIATQCINIATIAQYKIESGIVTEVVVVKQILEEALGLLEEVEMLFGTTLCDANLTHSLASLEMKLYTGSRMNIWRASNLAVRLLLSASHIFQDKTGGGIDDKESMTDRPKLIMRLWQWVQRGKARALSHSIGLDNVSPDSLLLGIRDSISKCAIAPENDVAMDSEAVRLQAMATVPVELLPEVRNFLKESNIVVPELLTQHLLQKAWASLSGTHAKPSATLGDIILFSQDLQSADALAERIKGLEDTQIEIKRKLGEDLSELNDRIAARPELHTVLRIADLLNREAGLLNTIQSESPPDQIHDRFQIQIDLQRLRQEMKSEPLLREILRIREGRLLSQDDLHTIAAGRNGKVVFVDWFSTISLFDTREKIYMVVWRNGTCELIDLKTTLNQQRRSVEDFFNNRDIYLPDVDLTPLEAMDFENMVPKNRSSDPAERKPVRNCFDLIKPLFDRTLVKPEDLLVFSVTEGFNNFPLHAVEDDEHGPLIVNHPVVYVSSLSVLDKCYWSRHGKMSAPVSLKRAHRALVLGGIESTNPAYKYGMHGVSRIGALVNVRSTTFAGAAATLANLQAHISTVDLLHIHLHTNYGSEKGEDDAGGLQYGIPKDGTEHDAAFTASPLSQALLFTDGLLSTRQILTLRLVQGAHLNLVACASGQQGKFQHGNTPWAGRTNEVMGLVPAFLFAGAGSVTSTLWPITDEHATVFGGLFWKAIGAALGGDGDGDETHGG